MPMTIAMKRLGEQTPLSLCCEWTDYMDAVLGNNPVKAQKLKKLWETLELNQ